MAGLYVHLPFCKSRCIYCGFFSTTSIQHAPRYVDALCQEMVLRGTDGAFGHAIDTIYLGGGTPSVLSFELLQQLFLYINNVYGMEGEKEVGEGMEITMECNPDDVTPTFANHLKLLPVNRISMGAQTFNTQRLALLHRRHTPEQVFKAVSLLRKAGIKNISIDLMYGFPNQTLDEWRADVEKALQLDVEHLSAYALSYEEGTPLWNMLQQGLVCEVDEEVSRSMYYHLNEMLEKSDYEHYEISNFSKRGFRSRHNSGYWTHQPYIGIGAGAHSFNGKERTWNVANVEQYIHAIEHGVLPAEGEVLDGWTMYNDLLMTALRTREGLNLHRLNDIQRSFCLSQARPFLNDGLLRLNNDSLILTSKGLFVSDMIMSQLMNV